MKRLEVRKVKIALIVTMAVVVSGLAAKANAFDRRYLRYQWFVPKYQCRQGCEAAIPHCSEDEIDELVEYCSDHTLTIDCQESIPANCEENRHEFYQQCVIQCVIARTDHEKPL